MGVFLVNLYFFEKNLKLQKNSCGTMWHYVALSNGCFFSEFILKKKQLEIAKNQLWHYVALCGAIKLVFFFYVFVKTLKLQKNNGGIMWHYVALSNQ